MNYKRRGDEKHKLAGNFNSFKMKLLLKKGINNSIEIQAVKFIITQGQVCESVSDRLTVCAYMHVFFLNL